MALEVFLQEKPELPVHRAEYEEILYFEDERYYWFLYPLFLQLGKRTGQFIDLYCVAIFGGDDLQSLAETIAAARQLTENQPDEWDEVRDSVNKADMLSLLGKLEQATHKATEKNYYLAFWGD